MESPEPYTLHRLPVVPNIDGRPVWEPPILNYDMLINDEYDKKREAALKYAEQFGLQKMPIATKILDITAERDLLRMYNEYACRNLPSTENIDNTKAFQRLEFYLRLLDELQKDSESVHKEFKALGIFQAKLEDGSCYVIPVNWGAIRSDELPGDEKTTTMSAIKGSNQDASHQQGEKLPLAPAGYLGLGSWCQGGNEALEKRAWDGILKQTTPKTPFALCVRCMGRFVSVDKAHHTVASSETSNDLD